MQRRAQKSWWDLRWRWNWKSWPSSVMEDRDMRIHDSILRHSLRQMSNWSVLLQEWSVPGHGEEEHEGENQLCWIGTHVGSGLIGKGAALKEMQNYEPGFVLRAATAIYKNMEENWRKRQIAQVMVTEELNENESEKARKAMQQLAKEFGPTSVTTWWRSCIGSWVIQAKTNLSKLSKMPTLMSPYWSVDGSFAVTSVSLLQRRNVIDQFLCHKPHTSTTCWRWTLFMWNGVVGKAKSWQFWTSTPGMRWMKWSSMRPLRRRSLCLSGWCHGQVFQEVSEQTHLEPTWVKKCRAGAMNTASNLSWCQRMHTIEWELLKDFMPFDVGSSWSWWRRTTPWVSRKQWS